MKTYICKYCGQSFSLESGKKAGGIMSAHIRLCDKNPGNEYYKECLCKSGIVGSLSNAMKSHKKAEDSRLDYIFVCDSCGGEFSKNLTPRQYARYDKQKHFCCRACANKRNYTQQTKDKISFSLKSRFNNNDKPKSCSLRKTKCLCCGVDIFVKTTAETYCYLCRRNTCVSDRYRLYTSDGKRLLSDETKKKLSISVQKRIKNGTHIGWRSRSIESYPEKFWKKVLDNNGISYDFNFYVDKKCLVGSCGGYFLDFKLPNNVDLEIDGKQHEYPDRKISDEIRTHVLLENGWIVYRVKWNETNSEQGKAKMKVKIDNFISWYKTLIENTSVDIHG